MTKSRPSQIKFLQSSYFVFIPYLHSISIYGNICLLLSIKAVVFKIPVRSLANMFVIIVVSIYVHVASINAIYQVFSIVQSFGLRFSPSLSPQLHSFLHTINYEQKLRELPTPFFPNIIISFGKVNEAGKSFFSKYPQGLQKILQNFY